MNYRTINLKPTTYEKLLRYKHMGMTFDEVISDILNDFDPIEMYEDSLEEHNLRLKAMEAGEYITLDQLKNNIMQI